jgi:hypothetical protein
MMSEAERWYRLHGPARAHVREASWLQANRARTNGGWDDQAYVLQGRPPRYDSREALLLAKLTNAVTKHVSASPEDHTDLAETIAEAHDWLRHITDQPQRVPTQDPEGPISEAPSSPEGPAEPSTDD